MLTITRDGHSKTFTAHKGKAVDTSSTGSAESRWSAAEAYTSESFAKGSATAYASQPRYETHGAGASASTSAARHHRY